MVWQLTDPGNLFVCQRYGGEFFSRSGPWLWLGKLAGKSLKHICLFYEETPSHGPIPPPIVRMARWPKTPGELERYIGAESVRTIRRKECCVVMCTVGAFIG